MSWIRHLQRLMRETEMNYSPNVNQSKKILSCVFNTTCSPVGCEICNVKKHWNILSVDDIDKEIFNSLPLFSFSRAKDVQDTLVHTDKQKPPSTRDVWTMPQVSFLAEIVLHVLIVKR